MTLLSIVAFAAIMGGFLLTTQAADTSDTTDANTTNTANITVDNNCSDVLGWNFGGMGFGGCGFRRGPRGGPMGAFGGFGPVEVSAEFEENVINIAKSDTDVQQLLDEGYNVTRIMPIIKTIVDGEGNVVTKATNATVMLEKDTTGCAFVSVDLEQGKVTQIVILTRTVIEKP